MVSELVLQIVAVLFTEMVCQTSDRPQVTEYLLEDEVPLVAPLNKGLPVGSVISLEGSVPFDAQE